MRIGISIVVLVAGATLVTQLWNRGGDREARGTRPAPERTGANGVVLNRLSAYNRSFDGLTEPCAHYWDQYPTSVEHSRQVYRDLSISVTDAAVGDFTGDGTDDGVLAYSCNTLGSSPPHGALAFIGGGGDPIEVPLDYDDSIIESVAIDGRTVLVDGGRYYCDNDPSDDILCDSVHQRYEWDGSGLAG